MCQAVSLPCAITVMPRSYLFIPCTPPLEAGLAPGSLGFSAASVTPRQVPLAAFCIFSQPREPSEGCWRNAGAVRCPQLLSLKGVKKRTKKVTVSKNISLSGFSESPAVMGSSSLCVVSFRKFVGFAGNAL